MDCLKCNGKCCKRFFLPISGDVDYLRWISNHVEIETKKGILYAKIPIKCKHLTFRGRCDIYKDRPNVCKDFTCEI